MADAAADEKQKKRCYTSMTGICTPMDAFAAARSEIAATQAYIDAHTKRKELLITSLYDDLLAQMMSDDEAKNIACEIETIQSRIDQYRREIGYLEEEIRTCQNHY